jgi:hypothetical protein
VVATGSCDGCEDVTGLSRSFLCSAASASSAVFWKADSMARESPLLKGIHFFGFGRGLSGVMACSDSGFRFGSFLTSEVLRWKAHGLSTYIYSVKPPHRKRRAVTRIPLQAQSVSSIDDVISTSLCAESTGACILLSLLLFALGLVDLSSGRCWRGLWGSCT